MAEFDGSIRIDTKIETKKAENELRKLENQIGKTAQEINRIMTEMNNLKNMQIPTEEFAALQDELAKSEQKLNSLQNKMFEWQDSGRNTNTQTFQNMQYQAEQLENTITYLKSDMAELAADGKAFQTGADTEEYKALNAQLNEQKNNLLDMKTKYAEINGLINEERDEIEKARIEQDKAAQSAKMWKDAGKGLQGAASGILSRFQKLGKEGAKANKKLADSLKKITKNTQNSGNAVDKLAKRITNLAKRVFFFSLITKAFRAMVSGIEQGMKSVAKQDAEFNKIMSNWATSTNTLKNQTGIIFSQILALIMPILTQIVSGITIAMNYISQFIALLSGQSVWKKATATQKDYAASLDKTAGSANKAANALAKFDDLDVLNKDSGGGSGSGAGSTYEEVPLEISMEDIEPEKIAQDLSDKIKNALESIDWDEIERESEELGRNIARFFNTIWNDEQLAKDIGHAIAGMLNTGVAFAYGFADETEWKQMGHFFGSLVQQGVEDFQWDKAGDTVGLFVNGFAEAVNGFFERYDQGAFGTGLAHFVNNMIKTADSDEIGKALANIIGLRAREADAFLKETDFATLGKKLSDILVATARSTDQDGNRLGQTFGQVLANGINAGIMLLIGADITGAAKAIGLFLGDLFGSAVTNIDWGKIAAVIITSIMDAVIGLLSGVSEAIADAFNIDDSIVQDFLGDAETMSNQIREAAGIMNVYASSVFDVTDAMLLFTHGSTMTADELMKLQDSLNLANEEMDGLVQAMYDADENLDDVSLGLEKYAGDWGTFRAGISETSETVKSTAAVVKTESDNMSNDFVKLSANANKSSEDIKSYIDPVSESMSNMSDTANNTADSTSGALERVSLQAGSTKESFNQLNANVESNLAGVSASMDDWFTNSVEPYFSEEVWSGFGESIIASMDETVLTFTESWNEQMITWFEEFNTLWTENLDLWKTTNEEMYFSPEIWSLYFTQIQEVYKQNWTLFSTLWNTNMTNWQKQMVEPFFAVPLWTTYGENMKNGIVTGMKAMVGEIGGIMNSTVDIFTQALENIEDAINDLVDQFNAIADELDVKKLSHVHAKAIPHVNIPELATGGVAVKQTLATIGEAGKEAVLPLENNTGWMDDLADKLASRMPTGAAGGTVILELDGQELAKGELGYLNNETNRIGTQLEFV